MKRKCECKYKCECRITVECDDKKVYRSGGRRYRGSQAQSRPLSLMYVIVVDYV